MKSLQGEVDGSPALTPVVASDPHEGRPEGGGSPSARLSLLLFGAEFTTLLILLALYKKVDRPLSPFLRTPAGHMLIVGMCATALVVGLTVYALRDRKCRRQFLPTLALNLGTLALLFSTAEMIIRLLAVRSPAGTVFGGTLLLPRNWAEEAGHNRAILKEAEVRRSYLVADDELGWAIRPSARNADYNLAFEIKTLEVLRHSAGDGEVRPRPNVTATDDSVYLSSVEGIRSPRAGMSYAALPTPRHRIALIGDSFTFGLEVRYEETWGNQLEKALGDDYQILNFGVDAYGVDQAYLRYRRDVVRWHPETVIFGVVSDDLYRSLCVYGFLCFPGSEIPFSKNRFVVEGDSLRLLRRPIAPPESPFAKASIAQLPLIQYDRAFDPLEWEWHAYDSAYSIRYLLSRYRRWSVPGKDVDNAALEGINSAIFHSFIRDVRANGATPVIMFFPTRAELSSTWRGPFKGREVLRKTGLPFIDATSCITSLPTADRYVVLHFSAAANGAVVECLRKELPHLFARSHQKN